MRIFKKILYITPKYDMSRLGRLENLLFFDIETTGLKSETSQLYLIGTINIIEDGWQLTQWFADSISSELEVIKAFFNYSKNFTTLIHYNGDVFDIPYLSACAKQYSLQSPLDSLKSIDLYKNIRSHKKIISSPRLNQKSIEQYLGLNREDIYNGGELINVYKDYIHSLDINLLQTLLLHNEEDLSGLLYVTAMLNYHDFLKSDFKFMDYHIETTTITLRFNCDITLPKHAEISFPQIKISCDDDIMSISILFFKGIAYHFFPDYKNYYYLPAEDMAVHKSIGDFVDSSARIKATAAKACIKKQSTFIPVFGKVDYKIFHREYKDKVSYIDIADFDLNDTYKLQQYAREILRFFKL